MMHSHFLVKQIHELSQLFPASYESNLSCTMTWQCAVSMLPISRNKSKPTVTGLLIWNELFFIINRDNFCKWSTSKQSALVPPAKKCPNQKHSFRLSKYEATSVKSEKSRTSFNRNPNCTHFRRNKIWWCYVRLRPLSSEMRKRRNCSLSGIEEVFLQLEL